MKWIKLITVLTLLLSNSGAFAQDDLCADKTNHNVTHVPRADVTHGAPTITIDDPIDIPLTIDMAERYALDLPAGTELSAPIGFISVYKDGRILYDGKDISGSIKDKCDEQQASENSDNTNTGTKLP